MSGNKQQRIANILTKLSGFKWLPIAPKDIQKQMDYFDYNPGCILNISWSAKTIDMLEKQINSPVSNVREKRKDISDLIYSNCYPPKANDITEQVISANMINSAMAEHVGESVKEAASYFIVEGRKMQMKVEHYLNTYGRPLLLGTAFAVEGAFEQTVKPANAGLELLHDYVKSYISYFFNPEGNYIIYKGPDLEITIQFNGDLTVNIDYDLLPGLKKFNSMGNSQYQDYSDELEGFKVIFENYSVDLKPGDEKLTLKQNVIKLHNDALNADVELNYKQQIKPALGGVKFIYSTEVDQAYHMKLYEGRLHTIVHMKGTLQLEIKVSPKSKFEPDLDSPIPVPIQYLYTLPATNGYFKFKPGVGIKGTTGEKFKTDAPSRSDGLITESQRLNKYYTIQVHTQNPLLPAAGIGIAALSIVSVGAVLFANAPAILTGAEGLEIVGGAKTTVETMTKLAPAL